VHARAWILDRSHRARRIDAEASPSERPLAAVKRAAAAAGLTLDFGPIGARIGEVAEFLFVHDLSREDWLPLADWSQDKQAWSLYVEFMLGGWLPPTRDLDVFHFGDGPPLAAKLAHMVLKGVKRGTTCWLAACERDGSPLPRAGAISIVTDGFGHALCAIRTERVESRRFRDVDAALAFAEGEGDRSLEDWREGHLAYFTAEAAGLGLAFDEEQTVLFEHFELIAVLGRSPRARID
jgi:uncharacterized protein YhfF